MAKSKKNTLSKFFEKPLRSLASVLIEQSDNLANWIKNLANIKKKFRKLITSVILFSAGLTVLGIGISIYLESLFPNLGKGISYIFIGIMFILVAALYSKVDFE